MITVTGTAQSWTYDGNSNLPSSVLNGQTTLYSYTQSITPNELLTQTILGSTPITTVFGDDQDGDTTSITSTLNTTTTLVYDSAARPITLTVVTPTTTTSVFLRYNAAGQRSAYSLYRGTTFSYGAQFTYRGAELGQAVVFSGTTSYTDTDLYDGQGAPLELIRQTRVGNALTTARYWYVLDGRGDVVALTDSSGSVVDRYAYGVWGSLVSSSEAVPQRLRYAGYWYDQELNWYWVGVRYYSPSIKRWLQPDPSQIDGVRTYVYVGDDPVDIADPSGLSGEPTPEPAPTPNATPVPTATPTATSTPEPQDLLTTERSIAERFKYGIDQVKDAIHRLKEPGVGGGRIRNPDIVVDGKTGDVYPKLPDGSLGDPIGNIHDEVDTRPKKRGRDRDRRVRGHDREWIMTQVEGRLKVGAVAGGAAAGGAVIIWWVGKFAAPACGPAAPVCVVAF